MPHIREVQATSHDRHDPMPVAALAAGDLAGTERDQAVTLITTCADCAALHDDLVALARATAAAPPPVTTRPRDFRLTPADAARLRPTVWRRFVAAIGSSRSVLSRPMGVGLATLGLVGLLVGNVQIPIPAGQSAAAPAAADVASAAPGAAAFPANPDMVVAPSDRTVGAAPPAAGSAGPTTATTPEYLHSGSTAGPSSGPRAAAGAAGGKSTDGAERDVDTLAAQTGGSVTREPLRPLNLLFGGAVILGLAILVASRFRNRRTS